MGRRYCVENLEMGRRRCIIENLEMGRRCIIENLEMGRRCVIENLEMGRRASCRVLWWGDAARSTAPKTPWWGHPTNKISYSPCAIDEFIPCCQWFVRSNRNARGENQGRPLDQCWMTQPLVSDELTMVSPWWLIDRFLSAKQPYFFNIDQPCGNEFLWTSNRQRTINLVASAAECNKGWSMQSLEDKG